MDDNPETSTGYSLDRCVDQVQDYRVTEVIRLDVAGEPAMSPENGSTIDELFDLIDEGLAVADQVEVDYDAELGFPRRFVIVWNRNADDGSITVLVDSLTISE